MRCKLIFCKLLNESTYFTDNLYIFFVCTDTIRQERRTPPHAGEMHPAMRERGRAIPSSHIVPRIVDRPEHIMPKMRPPLGGAGHVVPPPKGSNTMGILMPLYTIGIVLFFVYTIAKVTYKPM